jgi:phosphoribosylglycinamide formyltransferase-1
LAPTPCKLVVLLSGNGSNLQAIIDRIEDSTLNAAITGVISDKQEAYGLTRAAKHNLAANTIIPAAGEARADYDGRLQHAIDDLQPDWIILAGFMRILSDQFVNHYLGKIINIHPSLLPRYKGLNTHQRVLDAGENLHGVSVHFVTPALDDGPVIMQASLSVNPHESANELQQRIHKLEHQLYPQVIRLLCEGRVVYTEGMVQLDHKDIDRPLTLDSQISR